MTSGPFVTFVVAVRNGRRTIERCLESVWRQTDPDRELIVIDAASDDGTVDYLKANSAKIDFWLSEHDRGVYQAWNKALSKARGEWICFLGADDRLFSDDILGKIRPVLENRREEEIFFYGCLVNVNRKGEIIETLGQPWNEVRDLLPKIHCLPHSGAFHHRSMFDAGGFDERFKIAGDYDLLLRELRKRQACFVPSLTVVAMEIGGMSSDPANSLVNLRENRRAQRKWGTVGAFPNRPLLMAWLRVWIRIILVRSFGIERVARWLDIGRGFMGKEPYWTRLLP
ncbi:MAG TPA: glycosyltransferase family 2 protein [Candidatus Ozemobacteraceae bacterium]|nr:glycosyltransferase family 2 protein [Candidatus Ozemobacteraceae bacterium]